MKKKFLTFCLILISGITFAQSPISEGQLQLNLGAGFSDWGTPVYVGVDYGVHPDITIGGEASFKSFHKWGFDHDVVGLSANVNYHFNTVLQIPSNWDFYAGLNAGFFIWSSAHGYDGNHSSGLGLGAQVGGRYYWNDRWGINLEFGGGNEFNGGKIGVSLKF